jgi:signal transduction histidine kinase/CheY-like chemotaxis protein/HPt (histidine-containing phosphotransfer) domain-containing protein
MIMKLTKDLLRKIINILPAHIYWTDKDTKIVGANLTQAINFGCKDVESCLGKDTYDFAKILGWSKETADSLHKEHLEIIRTGVGKTVESTFKLADGLEHTYLSYKEPLIIGDETTGFVGISVDITDRKRVEEELIKMRAAKEAAELANEIKTQFIQNMEHDLRTPASGVTQMLYNLAVKENNLEQKETLQKLANASQRLLDLLNEIASFDKITSHEIQVLAQKVDLYGIANNIIELETAVALNKKLDLQLEIAKDVPQHVISDKNRIFRIFLNLIGNALKFTNEGHVKLSLSIAKQIDNQHCILKIAVSDTGIGIPLHMQHRIYERFERATPTNKGMYPGSGLGLSITKQFIEDLKGEIEVESSAGKGTIFTCLLPCTISLLDITNYDNIFRQEIPTKNENIYTPSLPQFDTKTDFSDKKILLVEDDEIAQMSSRIILADNLHTNFSLAKTGEEALKMVRENNYDLIFMDLGLPDIIGSDVTLAIRKTNKETPIVALTAHDKALIRDICRSVGMNDLLAKPLNIQKAKAVLHRWLLKEKNIDVDSNILDYTISNDNQIIDFELCKKILNGREDIAKQLWQVFAEILPKYLQDLKSAFRKTDITTLYDLSHKLRGAATYSGASKLRVAASNLCAATKPKKVKVADIKELYNVVCTEITEVLEVYETL